jgi:hypothetical protein
MSMEGHATEPAGTEGSSTSGETFRLVVNGKVGG